MQKHVGHVYKVEGASLITVCCGVWWCVCGGVWWSGVMCGGVVGWLCLAVFCVYDVVCGGGKWSPWCVVVCGGN